MSPRFFLDVNDEGHWHLIPEELRSAWEEWTNAMSYWSDDEPPDLPEGIIQLGSGPQTVTFSDPEYD